MHKRQVFMSVASNSRYYYLLAPHVSFVGFCFTCDILYLEEDISIATHIRSVFLSITPAFFFYFFFFYNISLPSLCISLSVIIICVYYFCRVNSLKLRSYLFWDFHRSDLRVRDLKSGSHVRSKRKSKRKFFLFLGLALASRFHACEPGVLRLLLTCEPGFRD